VHPHTRYLVTQSSVHTPDDVITQVIVQLPVPDVVNSERNNLTHSVPDSFVVSFM